MQKKRKVLVTGALGQLGSEIRRLADGNGDFLYTDYLGSGDILALDICDAEVQCRHDRQLRSLHQR